MTEKQKILNDLEPLFDKAEKEGLWFYCNYQELWFSPKELRDYHKEGRFIWGRVNWKLRNPKEKINEINAGIKFLENERKRFEL